MDKHTQQFKVRLGLFVLGGLALFVMAIFIIGKQQNLFNPVFKLSTTFYNVSGLQVGSNIRFSGIDIGTVNNIKIINDSTVWVDMVIQKEVQPFIKEDCEASIGSSGLIGDRVLIISQSNNNSSVVKSGQQIGSNEPIDTDIIMASLGATAGYSEIITQQLAQILIKVNGGQGTLGQLIQDTTIAPNLTETMENLKNITKGLDENMGALKENFLFKGYYRRKAKIDEKEEQQKAEDEKE